MGPKVAFCVTCKGRTQHLRITLPQNLRDNQLAQFVIVDYGDTDELRGYLRKNHHKEIQSGRLVVYHYPDGNVFRMAHAKNMAHRAAILEGAEILVNLDADNLAGYMFDWYVQGQFERRSNCFLWGNMIKDVMPRGISGRIACSRDAFFKVGGYDERFEAWGPDDKDFNQRLRLLGCEAVEIEHEFLRAVRHNDRTRFREYPHAAAVSRNYHDRVGRPTPKSCCVNSGGIGCGVVFRNYSVEERWCFEPIATRVFGIGMQKTATTSLHHAFEALGLSSAHWITAHWAKAIWREMNTLGYSPTLERHYALCDTPIDVLYRKLDVAYPGSRFVLTMRNEPDWLDSVRKHWDPEFNTYRKQWDSDPFSHRIHQIIYGRRDFDNETMLTRYRRHNAEVMYYFRNRPRDLLVMHMDRGAVWKELCHFLGAARPTVPYPRAYSAY